MKSQFIANLKNIVKKGGSFVKSLTVDTFTAIKTDIVKHNEKRKACEDWWKSQHPEDYPQKKQ